MPARRHRYGGGYRRRRRRRGRRLALVALVLLAAAAVAYWLTRDDTPTLVAAPCPTPSARPSVTLPQPQHVRLRLLNGTPRNGLATTLGQQLAARGFVVLSAGNASAALAGPSQVTYGAGAETAARVVSSHVLGSVVLRAPAAPPGTVTVVLGGDFRRLATPAEATAAQRAVTPLASALPTRSCGA